MKISVHPILVSFLFMLMGTTAKMLAQPNLQIPGMRESFSPSEL